MVIHFGKHKGSAVSELPTDYMKWLLENCEGMSRPLRLSVSDELGRRIIADSEQPAAAPPAQPPKRARPGSLLMPIGTYAGKKIKDIPKEHLWQYLWDEEMGDELDKAVIDAILLVHGRGYSWAEKNGYYKPAGQLPKPESLAPDPQDYEEEEDSGDVQAPPVASVPWGRPDCRYNEEVGVWELAIHPDVSARLVSGEIKSSNTPPWEPE